MSEYKVASRYAKALIDLHLAANNLEKGFKDMKEFIDTLKKNPALTTFLKSPIIHGHKKIAVMKAVFENNLGKDTIGFFTLIIEKKREYYLPAIAAVFIEQYQKIMKIGTAEVKSAIGLDAATNEEIRRFIEKLTGKKIEMTSKIDPSLIGGIVIKTGDTLYDASISGSLQKVKQELLNTYISK
jgi:F-type H+-transporting ATPase subunit delta